MSTAYIPSLLSALTTLDIALAYHQGKNKNDVVRKTARRLANKQELQGKEYLQLLIASKNPYLALMTLQRELSKLRPTTLGGLRATANIADTVRS